MRKTDRKSGDGKPLDEKELDRVSGGMDVQIGQVASAVTTTDGQGVLSSALVGAVVKGVTDDANNKGRQR
ncbi:MAG TPA: hypothetical protein VHE77_13590 [Dongiaceae bacterium]|jgi:hypothetical protein|nr:hypothetical protein [Dongiaceae bacterium]